MPEQLKVLDLFSGIRSVASLSDSNEPECEQSPSAKSTSTASECLPSDGQACQSTVISGHFAPSQQMLFAEDFPAKTSALPAREPALLESAAAYGQKCFESFAKLHRDSQSWRTSQLCLVEGLAMYSETWPRSGMTRSGTAYLLPQLAPLTSEIESGLLPTPAARDWKGSVQGPKLMERQSMSRGVSLEEFLLRRCLPTPSAGNSHSAGRLDEWGGANAFRGTDIGRLHLSPSFVEEVMGFPIGWTACAPLEMPSSRKSRKSSAERS
jgi:hypothetical protein